MFGFLRKLIGGAAGKSSAKAPAPEWPANLPPPEQLARELYESTSLRCSLAIPDPTLAGGDFKSSWIGKVAAAAPGEAWPLHDGEPMLGICQFNLAEAPIIPPELEGIAFIAVYMAREKKGNDIDFPIDTDQEEYRDKLCLRVYPSAVGLIAASDPSPKRSPLKPCRLRYEEFIDHRTNFLSELHELLASQTYPDPRADHVQDFIDALSEAAGEKTWRTKLGGWPAPIQDPIEIPLAFQIGSEPDADLHFIDSGCAYVWRERDADSGWRMRIEFY